MVKYRASILFVAVFLAIVLLNQFSVFHFIRSVEATAYGANWLTGWAYRKQHNITIDSGAGTNYQLSITMCNGTGTDSGSIVYENNKAKADFSDVRITDNTGIGLFYYWNQTVNTDVNATFWFRDTDDLTVRNSTIYVYYGNSGATWDSTYCSEASTFANVVANDVLALPMDEGSGTVAYDKSGNGNNGTLLPAGSEPIWVDGKYSEALSFDGTSNYVGVTANPSLFPSNAITIALWVNIASADINANTYMGFVCRSTRTDGLQVIKNWGNGKVLFETPGVGILISTVPLTPDVWNHVVCVLVSGSSATVYINGQAAGSSSGWILPTTSMNYWIGQAAQGTTNPYLKGAVDEVHIYNRALSQTEISDLFNNYGDSSLDIGKVLVRKYTSPAPAHGAWGIEETTNPPTYSNISVNSTVAGSAAQFSCLWQAASNMSGYIFSTNNTGSWVNDTWTSAWSTWPTTTSAWANVTKTLNATVGNTVSYLWYANDTSDHWSSSGINNLLTRETPNLQLTPDSITCRKYLEAFTVQINVTNASDIQAFNFTLSYDPSLLNCSSVLSGELAHTFTVTIDNTNGIVEGNLAGSPLSGNLWLLNITFQAAKALIWKQGLTNKLESKIWFHQAGIGFADNSTLQYVEGGVNQINVNQAAYTFLPIQGDVNNDGTVNIQDIRTVAAYYGMTIADPEWPLASQYDLTGDNAIDVFDLVVVSTNFGFTYP